MTALEVLIKCAEISENKEFQARIKKFCGAIMDNAQRERFAHLILDNIDKQLVEKASDTKV